MIARRSGDGILWWCPGCNDVHRVPVKPDAPNGWDFDGNLDAPTLAPSVLVYAHETLNAAGHAYLDSLAEGQRAELTDAHRTTTHRCHSFVRAGRIEFLADCTHELAHQTVPMGPLPAYLIEEP